MITERQEEQAALHALGLLEGAERSAFEHELAGDAELRALVASLGETSAALALTAPQIVPPAALKDRLLAAAPPRAAAALVEFPLARYAPWAVAACATFAALWFGFQTFRLRAENQSIRTERDLAEIAYKMTQGQLKERSLLTENMINRLGNQLKRQEDLSRMKVTALASLLGNSKEAQAIAVWDPDLQSGLLTVDKLPALADNQDYQLWVVDPAYQNPVNGGVFKVGADGHTALVFKTDQPIGKIAAFAVSLEKKGGVPKAEGPLVLLGK
ncbi:MAG: anti-sigma factor [Opitutae bacterium]|nr:anti-sigma factor [Opitutae bacterium]